MKLVEQHIIKRNDVRFKHIDRAAFLSKNLYNVTMYDMRSAFLSGKKLPSPNAMSKRLREQVDYKALPRKVSVRVLKQVCQAWSDYFAAVRSYNKNPEKFLGKPGIPGYKEKKGRNTLEYFRQTISTKSENIKSNILELSQLNVKIQTTREYESVICVRIIPHKTHYTAEVIYEQEVKGSLGATWIAGIDIGVSNLAAIASNKPGFQPLVVNGRPLKSINQYYNKERARLQSHLEVNQHQSHRLDTLADKRNRKLKHELHTASKRIVGLLVAESISTLVIGKNDGWKQRLRLGKRNNQNFIHIPHAKFIHMLKYKAELAGIEVILTEESYTSKCSALDGETLEHHTKYLGRRICRGLFRTKDGIVINADLNGAYNIIRKVEPVALNAKTVGIHPVKVTYNDVN